MNKKLFPIIIFLELICIVTLSFFYYQKKYVSGVSINWMDGHSFVFRKVGNLESFYEPKPHTKAIQSLKFLGDDYNYSITYIYNNDSLHQKEDISVKKAAGVYRIIAMGDSFTFGSNLNTKDTYPSQLEKSLNSNLKCDNIKKFEVLNFGMPGYDIQYSLERYKVRGAKYDPDLVLWLFVPDDFLRLDEVIHPKMRVIGKAMRKRGEIEALEKEGDFYADYKEARDEVVNNLGVEKILTLQKGYLDNFTYLYKKDLLFFSLRSTEDRYKKILQYYVNSRPHAYFYGDLISIRDYDGYFPDNHPNSKGAKLIAEDVKKYLIEKNIIPCR